MRKKNIRILLQRGAETRTATGAISKTWATYATVWGSPKTLRGSSYYAAEQTANETTIEMYIWYRSDIMEGDRAVVNGVNYEIATPPENLDLTNRETLIRLRVVK